MSRPLIDLSEFTYGDYKRLESYMEETSFLNETKQETEVNNLVAQLKKINDDLDNGKITVNTKTEIERIVKELNKNAEEIRKGNIRIFTTIFVVAELTKITLKIIGIVSFIRSICPSKEDIDDVEITEKDIEEMKKFKHKWTYVIYSFFKNLIKDTFTKENLKQILKDFFSIKTLLEYIRDALLKYTIKTSKAYMGYEKNADKSYEILINAEAKLEVEKKDAEKTNDKYTAECCDKIIKTIEEIKKDRVKQVMMQKQVQLNESTLQEDYLGNEYKIASFKIIMRDIDESLIVESENLRQYCNTALYIIKRVLEVNDKNAKTKIKLIEERIKAANAFVNDVNRLYDKTTLDTLLKKYGNIFSVKYSSYGLKARTAFEKKLVAHRNTILEIMKNYYHELSLIASDKESEKMRVNTSLNKIYSKIENKVSPEDLKKIKELVNKINDDSTKTFDLAKDYIKWSKENLQTQKIKTNLLYVLINAVFKD